MNKIDEKKERKNFISVHGTEGQEEENKQLT